MLRKWFVFSLQSYFSWRSRRVNRADTAATSNTQQCNFNAFVRYSMPFQHSRVLERWYIRWLRFIGKLSYKRARRPQVWASCSLCERSYEEDVSVLRNRRRRSRVSAQKKKVREVSEGQSERPIQIFVSLAEETNRDQTARSLSVSSLRHRWIRHVQSVHI